MSHGAQRTTRYDYPLSTAPDAPNSPNSRHTRTAAEANPFANAHQHLLATKSPSSPTQNRRRRGRPNTTPQAPASAIMSEMDWFWRPPPRPRVWQANVSGCECISTIHPHAMRRLCSTRHRWSHTHMLTNTSTSPYPPFHPLNAHTHTHRLRWTQFCRHATGGVGRRVPAHPVRVRVQQAPEHHHCGERYHRWLAPI